MTNLLVAGYSETLAELILDALENQNWQVIRGVQALDCFTEWTHLQGMESVINILFSTTFQLRKKAKSIRDDMRTNEVDYRYNGRWEVLEERARNLEAGKIPFTEIKSACHELSHKRLLENIEFLEQAGFIETDRQTGWVDSFVWLNPRYWDGIIDGAVKRGREQVIFSSSAGRMIATAAIGNWKRIPRSLQAIINAFNAYKSGKMTRQDLAEKYIELGLSLRKMENMIRRDSRKTDDIKLIESDDGIALALKQHAIRALSLWRQLAVRRAAQLRRKMGS